MGEDEDVPATPDDAFTPLDAAAPQPCPHLFLGQRGGTPGSGTSREGGHSWGERVERGGDSNRVGRPGYGYSFSLRQRTPRPRPCLVPISLRLVSIPGFHRLVSIVSNLPPPVVSPPPCSPGRVINHYVDRTPLGGRAGHVKGDEINGSQEPGLGGEEVSEGGAADDGEPLVEQYAVAQKGAGVQGACVALE